MSRLLVIGLVAAMMSGCMGTASKARPNKPSDLTATYDHFDPVTGEHTHASLTGTGAENADTPMTARITDEGIDFGGGTSAEFDWPGVTGEPLAWAGFSLILIGLGIFLFKAMVPIVGNAVPASIGGWSIALGFGVFLIPFVGPAIATTIQITLPILVLGAAGYYAYKAKWFEKATGTEAQMERLAKGDASGAAVMGFLNEGGGTRGKDKAKRLKNGNVTTTEGGG